MVGPLSMGAGGQLSQMARGAQGVPNPVGSGQGTGGGMDVEQLLMMLRTGQIGAEHLMQLLAALTGAGAPPAQGGPPMGGDALAQAFMG